MTTRTLTGLAAIGMMGWLVAAHAVAEPAGRTTAGASATQTTAQSGGSPKSPGLAGGIETPGDATGTAKGARQGVPANEAAAGGGAASWPRESVEADVATRSVAITPTFSGSQVVIFGAVENSRQTSAEAGFYDVVVVIEGTGEPATVRSKSRVAGIWVNTRSLKFDSVPGYYAIAATRPLDEIADRSILLQNGIGFEHVTMVPAAEDASHLSADAIDKFRQAVIELKRRKNLYFEQDYGVTFIGKSLFRSAITLPGNVPVGPLEARVFLLRDGQMLASFTARVTLQREGIERALYDFAHRQPVLYGLSAIMVAVAAGLAASFLFSRSRA